MKTITTRSGEELTVREVQPGDTAGLKAFNDGLDPRSGRLFLPHRYDDATLEAVIRRSGQQLDHAYVTLSGGKVVAYFFLWYFSEPIPVLGIGMLPSYQGQGLGKKLMEILIQDARDAGKDGIELTTAPDNAAGFALYQKMGFQYLGDVNNYDGNGQLIIERDMFLPLKPGARHRPREHKPPV
jgi:ribosomal protein S18 acetylase RimI-like enzyme